MTDGDDTAGTDGMTMTATPDDHGDASAGAMVASGSFVASGSLFAPCATTSEIQTHPPDRYPNRWRKGQSGNPNGRPLGSRHRATVMAEGLLDGQAAELIQKTIQLALDGDTTALRLCIERIVSPRRDRPVDFRLPPLNTAGDAVAAVAAIADGVASGDLTPAEAAELAKVVDAHRKAIETAELERRLSALEEVQQRTVVRVRFVSPSGVVSGLENSEDVG